MSRTVCFVRFACAETEITTAMSSVSCGYEGFVERWNRYLYLVSVIDTLIRYRDILFKALADCPIKTVFFKKFMGFYSACTA